MEKEELVVDKNEELEEESSLLTQVISASKNYSWIKDECLVVIVKVEKSDLVDDLLKVKICGKNELEWVKLATNGPEQRVIDFIEEKAILEVLRNISFGKKYVFLTYSDVPYLQHSTFCKILDYFSMNSLNVLRLPRGFVFKTDYLKNLNSLEGIVQKNFNVNEFEQVDNPYSFSKFYNFMSKKIKDYHKANGVVLIGEESIVIDSDVEIEKGVIIYPQNILKGTTSIDGNVTLLEGNYIENSVISEGSIIEKSIIINSKVPGESISLFSKIINGSEEK